MTNNYQAGKLSIQKCDKCRDGYLIVKQGRDKDFFLGCTNYKQNGTGCSRMISKQAYYSQMGYKMAAPAPDQLMTDTSNKSNVVRKAKNAVHDNNDIQESAVKVDQKTMVTQEVVKWNAKDDDYVEIIMAELNPVLYGELDLNAVVFNIVKALQNVNRIKFFGMTVFCEVLCGANNKKIQDNKLDEIPEYGIYKSLSADAIKTVVDWMISEHYVLKTKGKYPVLHSTYEGLHYSESITEGKLKKLKKELEGNKMSFDM
jgi:DNA helicase-4